MASDSITVVDDYTGAIRERLTGQRQTLGDVRLTKISVGPMDNNVYILETLPDGAAVLIDAADDGNALLAHLREHVPGLDTVVTTHLHLEHWGALEQVAAELSPTTVASAGDGAELTVTPDVTVADGDVLEVGGMRLEVIGLRGHTPDGIALLLRAGDGSAHLFSGDSLFPGGPGKTRSPEQFHRLMNDLRSRVFDRLDDAVVVHPGHGDDTTLGAERPQLDQWEQRGW